MDNHIYWSMIPCLIVVKKVRHCIQFWTKDTDITSLNDQCTSAFIFDTKCISLRNINKPVACEIAFFIYTWLYKIKLIVQNKHSLCSVIFFGLRFACFTHISNQKRQSELLGQFRLISDRASDVSGGRICLTQNAYAEL